jgi:hypothetical protein
MHNTGDSAPRYPPSLRHTGLLQVTPLMFHIFYFHIFYFLFSIFYFLFSIFYFLFSFYDHTTPHHTIAPCVFCAGRRFSLP